MKKNSPSQSLPELDLLNEGTVLDWLHKNSSNLAYGIAALIALFFLGYWFLSRNTVKYENDYFTAESAMLKLQDATGNEQTLEKLSTILTSHPDLQSKYDGQIAEALIQQANIQAALPYANRNLQRVKVDHLPFYVDYAEGSLLIAQNQYNEALQLAQKIQVQMEAEKLKRLQKKIFSALSAMRFMHLTR